MSKSLNDMMHEDMTVELSRYFINNESIQQIVNCVGQTKQSDSNIYSSIASFESAGIVEATEVPVGDEKQKMNYLLAQAISKATATLSDNLNIASNVIKLWGDGLVFDNQSQKLDNALARLNKPVKAEPIPPYSKMTEGQRIRTQAIFNKYAQRSESLSIDYITDAIDRYNAGASAAVLTKALQITIAHKNSVVMYDESCYSTLTDSTIMNHLIERFDQFKSVIDEIEAEGNTIEITNFLAIMGNADKNKNLNVHNSIKAITSGLNFSAPTDEYNSNSKDSASYDDITTYHSETNHVRPLDTNKINRLNALCNAVSKLKDASISIIDVKQTSMDEDQTYDAISAYFNFIEEFTQNLVVFMFITQIAVRNHTLIDEVISITTRLCDTMSELFTEVNTNIPEDGEVSQEAITASINYLKSDTNTGVSDNEQQQVYIRLNELFNKKLNDLERIKLRGPSTYNEGSISEFKQKQSKFIKDAINVDITDMSAEDIFNLITSTYPSENNNLLNKSAIALNLVLDNDEMTKQLRTSLLDENFITRMFVEPFATTTTRTFASATEDLQYHLSNLEEDLSACDIEAATKSLQAFIFHIGESSYYTSITKLTDYPTFNKVTVVPRVSYIAFNKESYTVGYGELDRSAQELLFAAYNTSNSLVSLNTIRYNPIVTKLAEYTERWSRIKQINTAHIPVLKNMERVSSQLETLKPKLEKHKLNDVETNSLIDALIADIKGAISDSTMRTRLVELTHETSVNVNKTLCEFYNKNTILIDDFIEAIK